MRIGQLADRVGVKPATVRYYETIGLLPTPARTAAGYRDYDQAAVVRLGFVRAAQGIGLSLGEVQEVLALRERGQTPCRHVQTLIEQRAAELADQIAELETMRRELLELADQARRLPPREDAAFCHIIEDASPAATGPEARPAT
ncbi:MAG: heavy metal-responsive transcriptional regulator [Natronosporangium sp.]